MKYTENFKRELIDKFLEEENYFEATSILIQDVKFNYYKKPEISELAEIYNSIAYLGNKKSPSDKQTYEHVQYMRQLFIKIFEAE